MEEYGKERVWWVGEFQVIACRRILAGRKEEGKGSNALGKSHLQKPVCILLRGLDFVFILLSPSSKSIEKH